MEMTEGEEKQLVVWENLNADDYLRDSVAQEKMTMENQVKETNERYYITHGHYSHQLVSGSSFPHI